MSRTDKLVLGTVNAPWKRRIEAQDLAEAIANKAVQSNLVHAITFFTEVQPHLIFGFAKEHGIDEEVLKDSYRMVVALTNERNPDLEKALEFHSADGEAADDPMCNP